MKSKGMINMASKKSYNQAILWLRSMAADKNSLDGINAELCLNIIFEQKERLEKLGIQFKNVKSQRDDLLKVCDHDLPYFQRCKECGYPIEPGKNYCPVCQEFR